MSQIINPPAVNYMPQQQPDFMQSYLEGLKFGQDLQTFKKQQELNLKQEAFNQDYQGLLQNPSGSGMLNLMVKYPEFAKNLQPLQEAYSTQEKQGQLSTMMQISSALENGNPELAKQLVEGAKTAFKNSGMSTQNLDIISQTIEKNPQAALGSINMTLAQLMGMDKYKLFEEAKSKSAERPYEIQKSKAEINKLIAQGKLEEAKVLEQQLKNKGTIEGQNQTKLAPGILQASTAIAQNNIESAKNILDTEMQYAQQMGMPTFVYRQALDFLDKGDTKNAKNVLDTSMLETYGDKWKSVLEGQTEQLTQGSKVSEAKSKATIQSIEAEYKPKMAKLELNIKKLEETNKGLESKKIIAQTTEAQVGTQQKITANKVEQVRLVGEMNKYGAILNENAGNAQNSYDTIDRLSVLSKNLDGKFEIEKKKTFGATGTVMKYFPTTSDVSRGILNDIDNIKNEVTLIQAGIHKGVLTPMSEKDVKILENATNSLGEQNSAEENQRQLKVINTIIKQYEKKVHKTTGLDRFQAKEHTPYIPQKVTPSGKKKDPLGLFNK